MEFRLILLNKKIPQIDLIKIINLLGKENLNIHDLIEFFG